MPPVSRPLPAPFAALALAASLAAQTAPTSVLWQQWTAAPEGAVLPDFSRSGYAAGEQEPPVLSAREAPVFHVADFGAIPDDDLDDRAAIQKAIDAATLAGGGIVKLGAGRYLLNVDGTGYPLWIRSGNIVLRGEGGGDGGTHLYSPEKFAWYVCEWTKPPMISVMAPHLQGIEMMYGEHHVGMPGSRDFYDGTWANDSFDPDPARKLAAAIGDTPRGSFSARVSHPLRFRPGDVVFMTARDKAVAADLVAPWDHRWFLFDDGSASLQYNSWPRRVHFLRQMRTVASVAGDVVTFLEPAYAEFAARHDIGFYPVRLIENVGLEGLRPEVVVTPRDDRWDANGTGAILTGVRHGWSRDHVFHNLQSGQNLGAGIHNEVRNVSLTGLPFHDSFKFLGTYNSVMRDMVVANVTIDPATGAVKSTDHGLSVQDAPMGNVYLDGVLPLNGNIDLHTGPPLANLYDRIRGGRHKESGGWARALHAVRDMTFWNWMTRLDATGTTIATRGVDAGKYLFPVFTGSQVVPYSAWNIHLVRPIVVGLHNDPAFNRYPPLVQFTQSHDFAKQPVFDDAGSPTPRVIAERTGTRVAPDSLYLAQRDFRLARDFGKDGPEAGIWIAVDGPNRVFTGEPFVLDFAASRSEHPLAFTVSVDGDPWRDAEGGRVALVLDKAGPHVVRVQAVSSKGAVARREWTTWGFERDRQLVAPMRQYAPTPRSFLLVDQGYPWQADLLDDYSTVTWIAGGQVGFRNTVKDAARVYGGTLTTPLPASGADLTGATFRVEILGGATSGSEVPRIVARDTAGRWGMLAPALNAGANLVPTSAGWMTPYPELGLPSAGFDPTRVDRVGVVRLMLFKGQNPDTWFFRLVDFSLARAASTPPAVAIATPLAGATAATGEPVALSVVASDAETAVVRVEYLLDGHRVAVAEEAPFSATWYPSHEGPGSLVARAWDSSGLRVDSAPVAITLAAGPASAPPALTAPASLDLPLGRAVDLQLSASTAARFAADRLPRGLVLDAGSGRLTGVPSSPLAGPVTFTATNAAGSSAPVAVPALAAAPALPGVALRVDPAPEAPAGQPLVLRASVTGQVTRVRFLADGVELGAATSAPWTFTWAAPTTGAKLLVAVAETAGGSTATSAPAAVTVLPAAPVAPILTVTSPADGAVIAGAPRVVTVSGSLVDPDGLVARVDLFAGTTRIGTATIAPDRASFSASWAADWGYDQPLRAVALGAEGEATWSEPILVSLTYGTIPSVTLSSPSPASAIELGQAVTLRGAFGDADGAVARVEVWRGTGGRGDDVVDDRLGNAVLDAATGTWSFRLPALGNGPHAFYAVAVDNLADRSATPVLRLGVSARFAPDPIYGDAGNYSERLAVDNRWDLVEDGGDLRLLVRPRFGYNYSFQNTLPASDLPHFRLTGRFRAPDFPGLSDGKYEQGVHLYFGNCIFYLDDAANSGDSGSRLVYVSGQYRPRIAGAPRPGIGSSGWVDFELVRVGNRATLRLDGQVLIDGTHPEILRPGPIRLANDRLSGSRILWDDIVLTPLDASGSPVAPRPTTVAISSPADQSRPGRGAPIMVEGTVADADGVARVELFAGADLLGEATIEGGRFTLPWTPARLGLHALAARATDGTGARAWSAAVVVDVRPAAGAPNAAPAVALTSPAPGAAFTFGLPVALAGTATDPDGALESVLVYADGQRLGAATLSPGGWTYSLPALSPRTWTITARAIDDSGAATTSAPVAITFLPNQPPQVAFVGPAEGAALVAGAEALLAVSASDVDGTVTQVEFLENDRRVGLASNQGGTWTLPWNPRVLSRHVLRARAIDSHGGVTETPPREVRVVPDPDPALASVGYVGGPGEQRLEDVLRLSDGTWLVAGGATDLGWTTAPVTALAPLGLPSAAPGKVAFLAHLEADFSAIRRVYALPAGIAADFRFLRTTSKPGAPTGAILASGSLDTGRYFVARLDGNLVDTPVTSLAWAVVALPTGNTAELQPWDVGADGSVAYATSGVTNGVTVQQVRFLRADGSPRGLPALRGTHWKGASELLNAETDNPGVLVGGLGTELPGGPDASAISFPRDIRSWSNADRAMIVPDGNGSIKRGRWPHDLFWPTQVISGGQYGYTGYAFAGGIRIGGIAIDRDTGDFAVGFNQQSRFWDQAANKVQPDFEPAVIAYAADGSLKWWSRLYHEVVDANANGAIDAGETRLSSPDQYVDGLAIDHSVSPAALVVVGRAHGNNVENLWEGNTVAARPGARGFANSITGTEGNIHVSWIGKLAGGDGTLLASTYVTGYFRAGALTQEAYPEPIHDGWPSHNAGNPNVTTTRIEPGAVRVDSAGRVAVAGVGPRMVTTFNAYQKQARITSSVDEGVASWAGYVRVYEPDLASLAYSSLLTGQWEGQGAGEPTGGNNTELQGVFPYDGGLAVVGHHVASGGVATGNPIAVTNPPAFGRTTPDGTTGILARLAFATNRNVNPAIVLASPANNATVTPGNAVQLVAEASDYDGTVARVDFYVGGSLVGSATAAPWQATWTPPAVAGSVSWFARAVDDGGASTTSVARTLKVSVAGVNLPPVVAIASPAEGTLFPSSASVEVTAEASDPDGTVARVDFFLDGGKVGEDSTRPFSVVLARLDDGDHVLRAVATDNKGDTAESPEVAIRVGGSPGATVAAVSFGNAAINDVPNGGLYWNGTGSSTLQPAPLLLRAADGAQLTDLTLSTVSPFGHFGFGRGVASALELGGIPVPKAVAEDYWADNRDGSDGFAHVRISSPTRYVFFLTILSGRAYLDPADGIHLARFNVGGTYAPATRSFDGGSTLVLDAGLGSANHAWGTLGSLEPSWDGDSWVLDLQVVASGGASNSTAYLNALHVVALPVVDGSAPPFIPHLPARVIEDFDGDGLAGIDLDASGAFDADGGGLAFAWRLGDVLVAEEAAPRLALPVGSHLLELTVRDDGGLTTTKLVSVTVLPRGGGPAPVAAAGPDLALYDSRNRGRVDVSLDGSRSADSGEGAAIVAWEWLLGGSVVAMGERAVLALPPGTHDLVLRVTDNSGETGSDALRVEVTPFTALPGGAVAITFGQATQDQRASGGLLWNGTATATQPSVANLQLADGSGPSGIGLSTPNGFDFTSGNRGANTAATAANGVVFPATVTDSYLASNLESGRDGLAILRLAAAADLEIDLAFVASSSHPTEFASPEGVNLVHVNVGGTWSASTRSFAGGRTVTLDASRGALDHDTVVLAGLRTTRVGDLHVLEVQVGYAVPAPAVSGAAALNGMHLAFRQAIDDPYDRWSLDRPGLAPGQRGRMLDPDRDGMTNLEEFLHGMDPATGSPMADRFRFVPAPGGGLALEFPVTKELGRVGYSVLWSEDLEAWERGRVVPEVVDDLGERHRVRVVLPPGATGGFLRLEITDP